MSRDASKSGKDVLLFDTQYARYIKKEVTENLPSEIAGKYEIVDCLASGAAAETFRARAINSGITTILKITNISGDEIRREDTVLRELDHPHIPKLIESIADHDKLYVVREYFDGQSLAELISAGRIFSYAETFDIVQKLCDIFIYLHSRPQPIIYRDLKPQNIIITADAGVKLVDFDIARKYNTSANTDTQYYGTKEYSPPEQFGYAQTDARTDVYALGVLIVKMLTGSTDVNGIRNIGSTPLQKLLIKSTQFSPKDRFANMIALKKQLESVRKKSLRRTKRTVCVTLIAAACLAAAFLAGMFFERYAVSPTLTAISSPATVSFESALVDQAVRLALNKGPEEPIYSAELDAVEIVQIWGNDVYASGQTLRLAYAPGFSDVRVYFGDYNGESRPVRRGGITSLEELARLKNLKQLDIVMQQITDISPLQGLPLERLNLAGNRITDLSAIENMQTLVELNINYNPVSDISPLSTLYYLIALDASDTLIEDVTPLAGLYHLQYLYINDAQIKDVSALADLELVNCFLENNKIQDVSPLEGTENLNVEGNPLEE